MKNYTFPDLCYFSHILLKQCCNPIPEKEVVLGVLTERHVHDHEQEHAERRLKYLLNSSFANPKDLSSCHKLKFSNPYFFAP